MIDTLLGAGGWLSTPVVPMCQSVATATRGARTLGTRSVLLGQGTDHSLPFALDSEMEPTLVLVRDFAVRRVGDVRTDGIHTNNP